MTRSLLSILVGIVLAVPFIAVADLKVATLHPLLDDLAKNVGGEHVVVVPMMGEGADPHAFDPKPSDLIKADSSRLILASGKGLETYLKKIGGNLQPGQEIFEVGRKIPSLKVEVGAVFACCPNHSQGAIDPHWWHGISSMQRATRYLAAEFCRVDPENAAAYKANAKAYSKKLDELSNWAKEELSKIPRSDRSLATSHAAFGYFCREFGFKAVPVQGLNREREPTPKYLGETVEVIKKQKIKAVFPEHFANDKVLKSMVRGTGVKLAGSLIADGVGFGEAATYEGMMRHNVSTIVAALGTEKE